MEAVEPISPVNIAIARRQMGKHLRGLMDRIVVISRQHVIPLLSSSIPAEAGALIPRGESIEIVDLSCSPARHIHKKAIGPF
jgi:hypothetical protein